MLNFSCHCGCAKNDNILLPAKKLNLAVLIYLLITRLLYKPPKDLTQMRGLVNSNIECAISKKVTDNDHRRRSKNEPVLQLFQRLEALTKNSTFIATSAIIFRM